MFYLADHVNKMSALHAKMVHVSANVMKTKVGPPAYTVGTYMSPSNEYVASHVIYPTILGVIVLWVVMFWATKKASRGNLLALGVFKLFTIITIISNAFGVAVGSLLIADDLNKRLPPKQ